MRVIAGSAKGRRLGPVPPGVRPVADRVREGLFSSLGDAVAGARVLDLFAGTGALGIEALSRGAVRATFVDASRGATRVIAENLRRTGLEDRGTVEGGDALRRLMRDGNATERFDVVFVDPPYEHDVAELEQVLERLAEGALAPGGRAILTRATRNDRLVIPVDWLVARRLSYGDTRALILQEA